MSDAIASQTALDPDRPWITNKEDLPARMNWVDTMLNPMGKSPKLHFTRAWTALFFAGFLAWFGVGMAIFIMGVTGVDTAGLSAFHSYLIAGVLGVTCLFSFIIHSRRLNHAGKSSLWAILVLVPLFVGAFAFMGGVGQKSALYQELYDARAEYLADPAAWREARLEERREEQAKAEAERARQEAEGESQDGNQRGQGQRRGGPGGPQSKYGEGIGPENPLPSKESFILRPNLGAFFMPIVLINTLLMIWSLTWVARTPINKRKDAVTDAYA